MSFFFKDPITFSKRPQGTDEFSRKLVAYDSSGFGWVITPDLSGTNFTLQPNPTFYRDFATYKTLNHGEGPNINFTRGTSATYFDQSGVLRMAGINEPRFDHSNFRTNLATWSTYTSSGNSRWTNVFPSFATILTGIDAPDGSTTAVRLSANNQGSALLRVNINSFTIPVSGTPYTLSFWCRKISGTGSPSADLHDGAPGNGISYADQLTDNVWRRVSLSGIPLSGAKTWIDVYDNKNTNLVLDYWGLQLETGLSATAYIPVSGSAVTVGESRGLLIEEARTNSIRNSQAGGAVVGAPGTLPTNWGHASPFHGLSREIVATGTANGFAYIDIRISGTADTTGGLGIFFEGVTTAASGQTWTSSAYVALVAGAIPSLVRIGIEEGVGTTRNAATFVNMTLSGSLQRFSATRTFTEATTNSVRPFIDYNYSSGTAVDFTLRIAAPQLEQGAFPTSYIPTTTAAATRGADSAVVTPIASFYNQSEGTLFAEAIIFADVTSPVLVQCDSNTGSIINDRIALIAELPSAIIAACAVSGASQFAVTEAISAGTNKLCAAFAVDNFGASLNGGAATTDSSGILPTGVSHLRIGTNGGAFNTCHIRKIAYWPKRLSNAFLQQQTQ